MKADQGLAKYVGDSMLLPLYTLRVLVQISSVNVVASFALGVVESRKDEPWVTVVALSLLQCFDTLVGDKNNIWLLKIQLSPARRPSLLKLQKERETECTL